MSLKFTTSTLIGYSLNNGGSVSLNKYVGIIENGSARMDGCGDKGT